MPHSTEFQNGYAFLVESPQNERPSILDARADRSSSGSWTHDYPITAEEAKAMGLPVSTGTPPEIYQLMHLFPQQTCTRPTVQYTPLPRRREQDQHGV
jgi:hypothetical protein